MAFCPICSDLLLRHIHSKRSYFYCQSCRLEMPEVTGGTQKLVDFSPSKIKSRTEVFIAPAIAPTNTATSIEVLAK